MQEDMKEYFKGFPIVKEVGSIRAKKILLEDAMYSLLGESIVKFEESVVVVGAPLTTVGRTMLFKGKIEFKKWFIFARIGIPSFYIACKTKKDWVIIREFLREKGFVRKADTYNCKVCTR